MYKDYNELAPLEGSGVYLISNSRSGSNSGD
jgi:hypothetical protein